MTDQKLQQLAREYAEQNPPQDIKDEMAREQAVGFNASVFEQMLRWLTKTHCIADKDKAKAFYNGDTFGELDFIELVSCRRILESLFGKSTFENPKEQEI